MVNVVNLHLLTFILSLLSMYHSDNLLRSFCCYYVVQWRYFGIQIADMYFLIFILIHIVGFDFLFLLFLKSSRTRNDHHRWLCLSQLDKSPKTSEIKDKIHFWFSCWERNICYLLYSHFNLYYSIFYFHFVFNYFKRVKRDMNERNQILVKFSYQIIN